MSKWKTCEREKAARLILLERALADNQKLSLIISTHIFCEISPDFDAQDGAFAEGGQK